MGEKSGIAWTDATFNPWWGCEKLSEACKLCYAERDSRRWGGNYWGKDAPRRFFDSRHWFMPYEWNKKAKREGKSIKVFCGSMCDIFEDRPDLIEPRRKLFNIIEDTDNLEWLLLTKRPENILDMIPSMWRLDEMPDNVWFGTTVENQHHVDRVGSLASLNEFTDNIFISVEPMLGPVDLRGWIDYCSFDEQRPNPMSSDWRSAGDHWQHYHGYPLGHEDTIRKPVFKWVIVGGESGNGARPMDLQWVRNLKHICEQANISFFMKQLGGFPDKRGNIDEWPEDLRVQQFPAGLQSKEE